MILDIQGAVQQTDYSCGDACIDTVIRYHGVRTNVGVLRLANVYSGMSPETIESLLRKAGLAILSGKMTVADLAHFTKTERPVICPITVPDEGGHYVVVTGVARGRVHLHDPSEGKRSVKVADWEANWSDTSSHGHAYDKWGIVAFVP